MNARIINLQDIFEIEETTSFDQQLFSSIGKFLNLVGMEKVDSFIAEKNNQEENDNE